MAEGSSEARPEGESIAVFGTPLRVSGFDARRPPRRGWRAPFGRGFRAVDIRKLPCGCNLSAGQKEAHQCSRLRGCSCRHHKPQRFAREASLILPEVSLTPPKRLCPKYSETSSPASRNSQTPTPAYASARSPWPRAR